MNSPHSIETVLDWIEQADFRQLQEAMDAIQDRFALLYPQWDILYLALPKNDPPRREALLGKAFGEFKSGL